MSAEAFIPIDPRNIKPKQKPTKSKIIEFLHSIYKHDVSIEHLKLLFKSNKFKSWYMLFLFACKVGNLALLILSEKKQRVSYNRGLSIAARNNQKHIVNYLITNRRINIDHRKYYFFINALNSNGLNSGFNSHVADSDFNSYRLGHAINSDAIDIFIPPFYSYFDFLYYLFGACFFGNLSGLRLVLSAQFDVKESAKQLGSVNLWSVTHSSQPHGVISNKVIASKGYESSMETHKNNYDIFESRLSHHNKYRMIFIAGKAGQSKVIDFLYEYYNHKYVMHALSGLIIGRHFDLACAYNKIWEYDFNSLKTLFISNYDLWCLAIRLTDKTCILDLSAIRGKIEILDNILKEYVIKDISHIILLYT